MAILLDQTTHKDSLQWAQEVVEGIRQDGINYLNLGDIIESYWVKPARQFGWFAAQIKQGDSTLHDAFASLAGESDQGVSLKANRRLEVYYDLHEEIGNPHTLYFNTVSGMFTTTPVPFETVLLYEDRDFNIRNLSSRSTKLSEGLFSYLLHMTDERQDNYVNEVIKRIVRRTNSSIRTRTMEDLKMAKDSVKYWEALAKGELLEINAPQGSGELFYYYRLLALYAYKKATSGQSTKESLQQGISEVIKEMGSDYSMIPPLFRIIQKYQPLANDISIQQWGNLLVEAFIRQWGIDPVIESSFYTTKDDGEQVLKALKTYEVELAGINVLSYLPDEVFEELFTQYLQAFSQPWVDFPIQTTTRFHYLNALEAFFEDPRAQAIVDNLGGLYTNSRHFNRQTAFSNQYSAGRFLEAFRIDAPMDILYINDAVYEGITKLYEGLKQLQPKEVLEREIDTDSGALWNRSSSSHMANHVTWTMEYNRLRPVSELRNVLKDVQGTVSDFEEQVALSKGGSIYIPKLSKGQVVSFDSPIEVRL